jgi:serine/threonine protein kinase
MPPARVLASRDCPLLPDTDLQCPHAEPGQACDIVANHPSSFGVSKIVFRGLTGHRAALKRIAKRIAKLGVDADDVVTVIWRDASSTYEVDATRAVHALDPEGLVMPRMLGVFTIHRGDKKVCKDDKKVRKNDKKVRRDFMAILHNLQSLPVQLQRPRTIQLYSDAIEAEFSASDSPETLTLMYQEYGGETLATVLGNIADAGFAGTAEEAAQFQRDMARGFLQLVASRDEILRPRGIAHLDIHHSNIVVRVPEFTMRLIDLGFSQNSVEDIVRSGLRRHDPMEYTMRKAAEDALGAAKKRTTCARLLQVAGKDADDYQYGTDPAFPLITPSDAKRIAGQFGLLLKGSGVTWEQLYAFVWSKAVQPHSRSLVPLEEFQRGVYGADADCRMLWDDFGLAWAGLVAYNTLQRAMLPTEPELETLREKLQARILDRFAGFKAWRQGGAQLYTAACFEACLAQNVVVDSCGCMAASPPTYRDRREAFNNVVASRGCREADHVLASRSFVAKNVLASRDCPLLPNDDLQCPHAARGTMCDVRAQHQAFAGVTKVVFRGLTGDSDFIRALLLSGCDQERVVTAIWQTMKYETTAEKEIAVMEKIAGVDPQGTVFPRYWGSKIVTGDAQSVRSDYLHIFNRLRKQRPDTHPQMKQYLNMLQRQFMRSGPVNTKLFLVYQDYGGPSLFEYVTKTLPKIPGNQLPAVQLALARGIRDLVRWREGTLCRAGIAHMDLHTNNIVLDEKAHFRMIDFGFHEKSAVSLMAGALEFHGPIEYAMLNAVVKVLQLISDRETPILEQQGVLEMHSGSWIVLGAQDVRGLALDRATPVVLYPDWRVLEQTYWDVLKGSDVPLQEMYQFVWARWQQVMLAGTGADVDLAQFQREVYGDGLRGMPRDVYSVKTQACLLWDDAEIAQGGIWMCNQVEQAVERELGPAGVAHELRLARHDLQQDLLRRFGTVNFAGRVAAPKSAAGKVKAAKQTPGSGQWAAPTVPPGRPGFRHLAGRLLTWLQPTRLTKRKRSPGDF